MSKEVINSIDRALDILMLLQQEGKEMGITQISSTLGIYKSTVHRTLATLEKRGFVEQNTDNGKYWLGIRLYSMGMLIRERLPLRKLAYPYARALAEKFNEVVHVSVSDDNAMVYPKHIIVEKIQGQQVLSLTPPIGSSSPSHCSAVGKCLLAFSPDAYIAKYKGNPLPAFTEKTIDNWDVLLDELEQIRSRGYAVDDEELEMGLTCIAGPILDGNSGIVAALSLSGPSSRVKARFDDIVEELMKTTKLISANLS